ncbi:MAG: hypothetical protein ABSH28_17430 [Acidobacteriota bacterium]|jgi:hypothetical protein
MPTILMISRLRGLRAIAGLALLTLAAHWAWGQARVSSPNDRARYLAAMPVPETSPLAKIEQFQAHEEQADFLAAEWQKIQTERWNAMTAWAATEVRPNIRTNAPLLYMFGGPDFLNAYILYPDASRYVLCGLETIGRVPPFESWPETKVSAVLRDLSSALKPALEQGFFVTKNIGGSLLKNEVYGVLPLIYVMVVRSGNEITDVQYVKLSESGEVIVLPGDDPVKEGARGVKINFVHKKGAAPQEMYYFRTDLSDAAIKGDKRFLNYLSTLGPANCYLKAAQYLMHQKEFSQIRELLLSQSSTILQDDSGIPYRSLDLKKWKISLYGNFIGPISEISWAVQPELKKAYAVPGAVKPLPFKYSYGSKEKANLLFATQATSKAP